MKYRRPKHNNNNNNNNNIEDQISYSDPSAPRSPCACEYECLTLVDGKRWLEESLFVGCLSLSDDFFCE